MRLALALSLALALGTLAGCQPDPETPPPKSCDDLEADWDRITMEIVDDLGATCVRDEDCVVIGGSLPQPTCNCAPHLPEVALHSTRVTLELITLERRYELLCGDRRLCDAAPSTVACNGGECMLSARSCFPTDAGP